MNKSEIERYTSCVDKLNNLKQKIAEIEGVRKTYIARLQELGFSNIKDVREYLDSYEGKKIEMEKEIDEKLTGIESQINEIEKNIDSGVF